MGPWSPFLRREPLEPFSEPLKPFMIPSFRARLQALRSRPVAEAMCFSGPSSSFFFITLGLELSDTKGVVRYRADMAHERQSGPDYGLDLIRFLFERLWHVSSCFCPVGSYLVERKAPQVTPAGAKNSISYRNTYDP